MRLTPFAKLFITVVILGVLGYAVWHYKGADVKQWAVGEKAAAPAENRAAKRAKAGKTKKSEPKSEAAEATSEEKAPE